MRYIIRYYREHPKYITKTKQIGLLKQVKLEFANLGMTCVPKLPCVYLTCLVFVGVLANIPGADKRSGLGAHAGWVIIHVSKLV